MCKTMKNFIAIEGIDGCGKSTIIERLKIDFPEIFFTREPGGTDFSREVRNTIINSDNKDGYGMSLAMYMSRFHNMILNFDKFFEGLVISDRWGLSNKVYQTLDEQFLPNATRLKDYTQEPTDATPLGLINHLDKCMRNYFNADTVHPTYIFIDIKAETSILRQQDKVDKDKMDDIDIESKRKVIEGYYKTISDFFTPITLTKETTSDKIVKADVIIIDGERKFEEVYDDVVRVIKEKFGL